jgi:N-hydroxyarylamine O-acetyltransferase
MTLMVTAPDAPQQRWLVDVGFGDSFNEPLLLDARQEQHQAAGSFRIDQVDDSLLLLKQDKDGESKPQYRFTLEPHEYGDYEEMCYYHQTSPQSHFTRAPMCSRLTADGRITLSGSRFISTREGERNEEEVADEIEFNRILQEQFGIRLRNQLKQRENKVAT